MRRLARTLSVAALLVATLAPRAASADDRKDVLGLLRRLLKLAKPESMVQVLSILEEHKDDLAEDTVGAYHFCDAIASYARPMTRHSAENAEKIVAWSLDLAEKAIEGKPEDVSAKWAKACALVARGRMNAEKGSKPPPDDWVAAADLVTSSERAAAGSGGRGYALASGYLVEAAELPGAPRTELLDRAEELAAKAGTGEKGAVATAIAALGRAKTHCPAAPAKAKPYVDKALAALEPLVSKTPPDMDAATLHTAIVTFARANKVPGKVEYRMVPKTIGGLSLSIPLSKGWEKAEGGSGGTGGYDQHDALGNHVRSIRFDEYDWTILYMSDEGEVGGDNVKGLSRIDQKRVRGLLSELKAEKDLSKGALNRFLPTTYAFEMAGTDTEGEFTRYRVYYFKGKESMRTFNFQFVEHVDTPRLDPEIQAVLDSIQETKKKK